jgi:hypothetical protein
MPTAHCKHGDHLTGGPSAWPVLGLIAGIAVAAGIIAVVHQAAVALALVAVLILTTGWVMVLWHRSHTEPDAEPVVTRADVENALLRSRVGQLEHQLAAQQQPAIEQAPVVHNHLHLHSVSAAEAADLADVARKALTPPGHQRRAEGLPR